MMRKVLVLSCALTLPVVAAAPALAGDVSADALAFLQRERAAAGLEPVERLPELDAVAFVRASEMAGLPLEQRGPSRAPILPVLVEAGLPRIHSAVDFVDTRRPTTSGEAFARLWRSQAEAWQQALDPDLDAIGLATAPAGDEHTVFVAVLVRQTDSEQDREWMVRRVIGELNGQRQAAGLPILEQDDGIAAVAQAHAEEMARLGYLAVRSPEGVRPYDRLKGAGIDFAKIGTLVARNTDATDPAGAAVIHWITTPSAQARVYEQFFDRAGIGIAMDDEGTYYFSAILLRSPVSYE
jgi:uncharacterized protein YkwD